MKQKTNWVFLVFVVVLGVWVGLYIKQKDKLEIIEQKTAVVEHKIENFKIGKIGDLEFKYRDDFLVEDISEDKNNINFKTIKITNNLNITVDIFYTKNANKDNLDIENWWDKFGPQNERQAPYPNQQKKVLIAGIECYEVVFNGGYNDTTADYDTHDIYFTNNNDVYSITFDQKRNEINNNVNQILSSFKFVE